ncbi:MAG: hypothetical protein PHQ65_13070 [Bacteroidales bacterium]|nr:hypothetical protein [Bacteroidales bacterium]MDD3666190.1 hypothetical protein [Bacteroidales bacterium]
MIKMLSKGWPLFLLFIMLIPTRVTAQCCAAGSPASVNPDLRPLRAGSFSLMASMRYAVSEAYFQNDTKLEVIPLITSSDYWFGQIQAGYTVYRGIELNAGLGYFLKKAEHSKLSDLHSDNGYGLSDLTIGTRALIWRSTSSGRQFYGSLGITLPTGQFDLVRNNVKLPVQLQPSAGTFKYRAAVQYIEPVPALKTDFFAQAEAETSAWIVSDHFVYKYGNYYTLTLGGYHAVSGWFTLGIQARGEWRERSQRDESIPLEATGFRQVSLVPMVSLQLPQRLNIAFLPQLPVYRFYNGIQLANSWSGTFSFSYSL